MVIKPRVLQELSRKASLRGDVGVICFVAKYSDAQGQSVCHRLASPGIITRNLIVFPFGSQAMAAATANSPTTPDALTAMPDEKNYELVGGQLVERHMGVFSSWIGVFICVQLGAYCLQTKVGYVWPADNGYTCFPDDLSKMRKPDVSFVRRDRLPSDAGRAAYLSIAPGLAVEIISPKDLADEIDQKVDEYLSAGVKLVRVGHPLAKAVRVHRADGPVTWLSEGNELSGEEIIPGFCLSVGSLFDPFPA
jgi:Uma2 family endonuclease